MWQRKSSCPRHSIMGPVTVRTLSSTDRTTVTSTRTGSSDTDTLLWYTLSSETLDANIGIGPVSYFRNIKFRSSRSYAILNN